MQQMRLESGIQPGRVNRQLWGGIPDAELADHLASPGCSKIKGRWDRCGVYYVNPIERLER
jgi:hypothetical protein